MIWLDRPARTSAGNLVARLQRAKARGDYDRVFQFRVTLKEITPEIWRRIRVPATYSFWDLHVAIQDAFGWLDYHLHRFLVTNPAHGDPDEIGIPDEDGLVGDVEALPSWEIPIADYFTDDNPSASYEYDFGDGWEHDIVFEGAYPRETGVRYPVCLGGRRACPPEDCGGPTGYAEVLVAIRDENHPEHESMLVWTGGRYDPERFSPEAIRFDDPRKRWRNAFQA